MDEPLSDKAVRHSVQFQGRRQARIAELGRAPEGLKTKRRQTARRIAVKEFPQKERCPRPRVEREQFVDTIKLVAYRAEAALAETLRARMARRDDARALPRQIFDTEIDLVPDSQARTLTVYRHRLTQPARDAAARYLCQEPSVTETVFPGTQLRMVHKIGSHRTP